MAALEASSLQRFRISGIHLIALSLSTLLGLAAGSAFWWASLDRAWSIFLAGFLWTLLVAVGTAVVRCVRERVRRGQWWRGVAVGCEMTFPLTTLYLLAVILVTIGIPFNSVLQPNGVVLSTKPDMLMIAPMFYTASLVVAIVVGPVYVLTSPFRRSTDNPGA